MVLSMSRRARSRFKGGRSTAVSPERLGEHPAQPEQDYGAEVRIPFAAEDQFQIGWLHLGLHRHPEEFRSRFLGPHGLDNFLEGRNYVGFVMQMEPAPHRHRICGRYPGS